MHPGRIIPESNSKNDPFFNLALEQAILSHHKSLKYNCTLRFWRNTKTVVLGRNQDINKEINIKFCEKNNILITRRISGGGAVYQDLGNLNISIFIHKKLISIKNSSVREITAYFTKLIKNTLSLSGLKKISISNMSSILYNNLKISGSAGYISGEWILHHFTLLQEVNLINIEKSLLARPGYEVNKSRASNYYKTTNLPKNFELSKWKYILRDQLSKQFNIEFSNDYITDEEQNNCMSLKETMYKTKKWIYDQQRND